MGRAPCCEKVGLHRGPWTSREDALLTNYIKNHGATNWKSLPKRAGLLRCGKSCRLRWMNYIRPDIKRGNISPEEEDLIIRLHSLLGNKWSLIAGRLPGRTDNEIKNYWNGHLSKKLKNQGVSIRESISRRTKHSRKHIEKKSTKERDTMYKIYVPKATRIEQRYKNYVMSYVSESNEEIEPSEGRLDSGDEDSSINCMDLDLDFDLENDDVLLEDHKVLERVYQEYLQLLNVENEWES